MIRDSMLFFEDILQYKLVQTYKSVIRINKKHIYSPIYTLLKSDISSFLRYNRMLIRQSQIDDRRYKIGYLPSEGKIVTIWIFISGFQSKRT